MSLGHPIFEPAGRDPLVAAVQNAVAKGIVVVVSAGNFGGNPQTHETGYAGITSPGNAPARHHRRRRRHAADRQPQSTIEVAWYSSRGPTWYDGFQKPDIVAPGTHLVSNISTTSTIYRDYPNGIVKSGAMPFFKMSGTSMSAPVVAGVVANMIQAARDQRCHADAEHGQGDPAVHGDSGRQRRHADAGRRPGERRRAPSQLAAAIKKNARSWAVVVGHAGRALFHHRGRVAAVEPADPVGRSRHRRRIHLHQRTGLGHGGRLGRSRWCWGDRMIWGDSTVFDGNEEVWGNAIVWGDSLLGTTDGTHMVWGDRIVWGDAIWSGATSTGSASPLPACSGAPRTRQPGSAVAACKLCGSSPIKTGTGSPIASIGESVSVRRVSDPSRRLRCLRPTPPAAHGPAGESAAACLALRRRGLGRRGRHPGAWPSSNVPQLTLTPWLAAFSLLTVISSRFRIKVPGHSGHRSRCRNCSSSDRFCSMDRCRRC